MIRSLKTEDFSEEGLHLRDQPSVLLFLTTLKNISDFLHLKNQIYLKLEVEKEGQGI